MKKSVFNEYPSTAIRRTINEYVHHSEHREILCKLLLDGMTYKSIADEHYMSEVAVAKIFDRYGDIIYKHIEEVSI